MCYSLYKKKKKDKSETSDIVIYEPWQKQGGKYERCGQDEMNRGGE